MTKRQSRMLLVAAILVGGSLAAFFAVQAIGPNMLYFHSPTAIANGEAPVDTRFRVGGLVVPGSVVRDGGGLTTRFSVTDNAATVHLSYDGILPDLFREGQGIVAHGRLDNEVFVADTVLAKHDENYMPPEVADALKATNAGVMPFGEAQRGLPEARP